MKCKHNHECSDVRISYSQDECKAIDVLDENDFEMLVKAWKKLVNDVKGFSLVLEFSDKYLVIETVPKEAFE